MAYKIVETAGAERDLSRITEYILHSLENRTAAAAFLDEVEKCYDDLSTMPMMYEACRTPHLRAMGYRRAGIRSYIMIYKVDEAKKEVVVLRFFHGRQDYEKLL